MADSAPRYREADRARWVPEDRERRPVPRSEFARDRARLIHSASLRRLAAKTQVLGPGSDDFVRNRLTHSLEVAQIGREFGAALGCDADVVDTACLAHDLGHPPFGHNGESVLNQLASSIGGFEGNAQTLRILTRLEAKRFAPDGRSVGLNLTRASLDAATKYPYGRDAAPQGSGKFGVYADDLEVFAWLREGAPPGVRSVEAEVMDWSDDVAYSVHDIEDAIASGRLDPREFRDAGAMAPVLDVAARHYAPQFDAEQLAQALDRIVRSGLLPAAPFDGTRAALARLKDMTSQLIGRFVASVEAATRAAHGPGPHLRYSGALVVPDDTRAECEVLKATAAHFVMLSEDRRTERERQAGIIEALVTGFREHPEHLDPEFAADLAAAPDDAARLRVVIDQVASLTDVRARVLTGPDGIF